MNSIIGIDLGTSTTEAAVFRDGKPRMLLNFENKTIIPSAVGIDKEGNWVIGERAKAQALLDPEHTALEIKRKIGLDEMIKLGNKNYSPVELSAKILDYVANYASACLKEEVKRAVISVPAYFTDIQRQETLQAGEQAGLRVERILNEPTAAALSYGLDHMEEESHILVYDLGGGTFDVTLLEMFDGVLEVKASSGDNALGGKDFNEQLGEYLRSCFIEKQGVDLKKDRFAWVRVMDEAEKCKIALSGQDSYRVLLPAVTSKNGSWLELDETVTRDQFRAITEQLMRRTHGPLDVVFQDSGLTAEQIDKIILVGGSTRMPMVAEDIQKYLGKTPESAVDPDLAVARGAAIMGGIISGEIRPEEGILMTDVNPYTLGIQTANEDSYDRMSVVIPRNVTIPTSRSEIFYTYWDYQEAAAIRVFQGESRNASSNHFLGEFELSGIPRKKAGKESLRVRFAYDLNGILNVTATIVSTGKSASVRINMLEEQAENKQERKKKEDDHLNRWKEVAGSERYRAVIRRAERALQGTGGKRNAEMRTVIRDALNVLKEAILLENWPLADETEKVLMAALNLK